MPNQRNDGDKDKTSIKQNIFNLFNKFSFRGSEVAVVPRRRYFTEDKIKYEGEEAKEEEDGRGDDSKPLIIVKIFTLEIREPIEFGHKGYQMILFL